MLALENFAGLHVWDKRRTLPQNSRARPARLTGRTRVDLVHLVCLVHLVSLAQPTKQTK